MSPKDQIFDFFNLLFAILLIAFCIFYFIAGDRLSGFILLMKSMMPLALLGIIFLIKLRITRKEIKKRKNENNTELVLYLNISHKLVSDTIIFCAPILLGFLIYKFRGSLDALDTILLAMVFLIMFFWQRYIFSKEK